MIYLLAGLTTLSAVLLFGIQPVMSSILLPKFGGAASVWIVSLLFFSGVLVAGYFLAYLLATITSRRRVQMAGHSGLAALACLSLVVTGEVGAIADLELSPALSVLVMLLASIGLPMLVVAAISPLVQNWSRSLAAIPWRFYALSNLASLAMLLAYPLVFEPVSDLSLQLQIWKWLFCLLTVLLVISTYLLPNEVVDSPQLIRSSPRDLGLWLGLAALGTALLAATSSQLTRSIAPIPLLWVVPLAIYLLTWVLTFDSDRWYHRRLSMMLTTCGVLAVAWIFYEGRALPASVSIVVLLFTLFFACMVCHGELALSRPGAERLTTFYLMIAVGGFLGSLSVALLAPVVLDRYLELPVALVLLLAVVFWAAGTRPLRMVAGIGGVAAAIAFVAIDVRERENWLDSERTFYAHYKVQQLPGPPAVRRLHSDATIHGSQRLAYPAFPTTYYSTRSGSGVAMDLAVDRPFSQVAVIGLGAGTLAAYGRRNDDFVFYEIDPAVEELARKHFTFLDNSEARIRVEIGDARLSLEESLATSRQRFQAIIVDAFSGDAVAAHLMTREAWDLYLKLLNPYGVLAIHITNHHFDYLPVFIANNEGRLPMYVVETLGDGRSDVLGSRWIVVSEHPRLEEHPLIERYGERVDAAARGIRWTDERHSVVPLLLDQLSR